MSLAAIERRIEDLTRQMAVAAAADDFELAARLRDEIAELKGQAGAGGLVRQPPPGQMGLGTHIPVAARPKGWTPPKKPDPLTKNTRGRKR